jgi:5-methylcytosine-specific restriction endonuclease McrA
MGIDTLPSLKKCTKCKLLFPATSEYFYARTDRPGKLRSHCRACERPVRAAAKQKRLTDPEKAEKNRLRAREIYAQNAESMRERKRLYLKIPGRAAQKADYDKAYKQRPEQKQRRRELKVLRYDKIRAYEQQPEVKARRNDLRRERRRTPEYRIKHADYERKRRQLPQVQKYLANYHKQYRATHKDTEHWKQMKRAEAHRRRSRLLNAEGQYTAADIRLQLKSQNSKCWHCGEKLSRKYEVDHLIPLARGGSNRAENIVISCRHCNRSKRDKLTQEWNGKLF